MRMIPLLLVACGCAADPDPAAELAELLATLPPPAGLAVALPAHADAAKAPLAEPAPLYVVTRQASQQVNGMVGGTLRTVWDLAHTPPASRGDGWAVWGPFASPLSPAIYRLVVARDGYRLDIRARAGGDFAPLLAGTEGAFTVDLSLGSSIDPIDHPGRGRLEVAYQVAPAGATIHARHVGDAYDWQQRSDGAGDFALATGAGSIRSHWNGSGAGRAEARAGGGATEVQCWDQSFALVGCGEP